VIAADDIADKKADLNGLKYEKAIIESLIINR